MLRVVEPATESVMAEVEVGDVEVAVAKAVAARTVWAAVAPADRGRMLLRIAEELEARSEELARLESRNVGKPITSARGEVAVAAHTFRYYAAAPERLLGETIPVSGGVDVTFREPLGVVGLIVPWNFPLAITSWKVAPALAAGNTVVLKPSELTPLTAIELERCARRAGLPDGVLNVVNGPGETVGEQLVAHPDVSKVAFTGSTAVGRRIAEVCGRTIKRVTLELGGKSASIVFADADVEAAAAAAPWAVFDNAGQDCCARSRILVERTVLDDFLSSFESHVKSICVGDPLDEQTQMGPLVSAEQREKVASYVTEDSPVVVRGDVPEGPGYWYPPTVLCPVDNSSRVAREEVFGPVAAIIPFSSEEEAVQIANDTVYGLSGSIWTQNGARALRVARALETGTISVNSNSSVRVSTPFGGFKQSGLGRELGPHALDHYTELKNVYISTS